MKIHVNRIPAEGLREHASYDPTTLDMDCFDIRLIEPFEVEAFITKVDQELIVEVDVRAPLHLTCARCLEEFTSLIVAGAVFSYKVQPSDIVDIAEDVRQEIILAYPMIPICRVDCKGLCKACGQNLNVSLCSHSTNVPEGP